MLIEKVRELDPLSRLIYWCEEREAIRIKKEAGLPRPYTDDKILDIYRFCNVVRWDDRVSRWLNDEWYGPRRNHPNSLVAAALARFFNFPSTLKAIEGCVWKFWKPEEIKKILKDLRDKQGQQIFNGAYLVSTNGRSMDKIDHVVDMCVQPLFRSSWDFWIDTESIRQSCENLQKEYGLAGFMSGQIVADLRWALDGSWDDKCSWAAIGPGSLKGINIIHSRPISTRVSQRQFDKELRDLMKVGIPRLPTSISSRMEAIDWQNCLCETSKYQRCLEGGRCKSYYTPHLE